MSNKNRKTTGERANRAAQADFTFHGRASGERNWWNKLLPSARAKMVKDGLFTEDGKLTDAGRAKLRDVLGQSARSTKEV